MILLGPPASGKGTQGRLIHERWGVDVTSIGEMLRRETTARTSLGLEAERYTANGKLVPDRLALECVEGWLAQHGDQFVFDGFPRTVGQAEALEKLLAKRNAPLSAVIWLELNEIGISERVSKRIVCSQCGRTFRIGWQIEHSRATCPACGGALMFRHDDQPQTLAQRMVEYRKHTEPLIDFYSQRGLLRRVDADHEVETVFAQIEAAVNSDTGVAI